jgi:dihydroorotate dehydrogenase
VGLGPGIDTHAVALSLLQHLGFGYLSVGPVSAEARPRRLAHDPLRLRDALAIVSSPLAGAPGAAVLVKRVAQAAELRAPVGFALAAPPFAEVMQVARAAAAFFTVPAGGSEREEALRELRALTDRPLLLRLPHDLSDADVDALTDAAASAGIDGCVATAGAPCPLLASGEMDAPFVRRAALRVTERIAKRHGAAFPIIGAGGVFTPEDALAFLDAGATLVELYAGFVYAGPGLPARILAASAAASRGARDSASPADASASGDARDSASPAATSPDSLAPLPSRGAARRAPERRFAELGPYLVGFTGLVLIGSGVFALILAATVKLLPYDVAFLGMSMTDLCDRNACRIVHFMAHDRVSFGGSIISVGTLYAWLGAVPLRRGEAWAWWTALLSGIIGFGSFLTYLGYGYLDVWHGRATLALLPVFVTGLILSFRELRSPRGPGVLGTVGAKAWIWSPAGLGRLAMTFTAFGMIAGGLTIMGVGMTRVFVPQDLEFMGVTVAELHALNPRLVPLIAHDRAGFGGGLCSTGVAVMACVWYGIRPGAAALWRSLLIAGTVGFACASGAHPVVGYTSFVHLAPAYAGALAFAIGMALLHRPMCRTDEGSRRFPDL